MAYAVLLQFVMTAIVAALAVLIGGVPAGISAAAGGLSCAIPNALFAFRLHVERRRPGGATVQGFFVGEIVKLVATVVLLYGVARTYHDLNWLALIVGFIAVLKSYFLMFMFGRSSALLRG
jgi:ATP synthase protein I